jgi:hypothetical protein
VTAPRAALATALWLLAACDPEMARLDAAVARMNALDARVDAGFDAARARHDAIFTPGAWDDPKALAEALAAARSALEAAVADHVRRLETEREIVAMETLAATPETRALYRMDLAAQEAKAAVLALTLELYRELARRQAAGERESFLAATRAYAPRIQAADDRYRELDLARQRRQRGGPGPI